MYNSTHTHNTVEQVCLPIDGVLRAPLQRWIFGMAIVLKIATNHEKWRNKISYKKKKYEKHNTAPHRRTNEIKTKPFQQIIILLNKMIAHQNKKPKHRSVRLWFVVSLLLLLLLFSAFLQWFAVFVIQTTFWRERKHRTALHRCHLCVCVCVRTDIQWKW